MKVTCEYCGTHFNTLKHDACPSCGASLEGNVELQKEMAKRRQVDELHIKEIQNRVEREKLANEAEKQKLLSGYFRWMQMPFVTITSMLSNLKSCLTRILLIPILIFALLMLIGIVDGLLLEPADQEATVATEATQPPHREVSASFGEKADTGRIAITCDKFEEYNYRWETPKEGFKFVRVHVIVENTSDKTYVTDTDITGSYENESGVRIKAQESTIRSEDLGTCLGRAKLDPGMATEGWLYFTVPVDADLTLSWGDVLTIHVDGQLCENAHE